MTSTSTTNGSSESNPFAVGPAAYGCPACQAERHWECRWLEEIEEFNSGAWHPRAHREYVEIKPYGICVCAAADQDMHLDPRMIDEEQERASS